MKRILLLSLLLLPIVALAQYPTFSNKQKLGVQTTGDGLIFRGNSNPSYNPSNINNAYFYLDTTASKLYLYSVGTWQQVYPTASDTTSLGAYLLKSDTLAMLLPYLRKSDTISLSNRINNKLSLADTASMLLPYLKLADTTSMLTPYFRDSDTTMLNLITRFNSKLNTTDTVSLSNRIDLKLNKTDTINLSNRIDLKLNKSDTISLSNRIDIKLNASDTVSLSNRINTKLNSNDTINLSNRINKKLDTLYVNYQTNVDLLNNKDTINITSLEAGAGINITNNVISLDTTLLDSVVRVQNVYVKNGTGTVLNKGEAVYVTGANGTNIIVGRASNVAESSSSKTLGLTMTSIAINGFGYVVKEGLLAGLNTNSATAGDPIWLSNTPGGLIFGLVNKPYAPNHLVYLGVVTRKQQNNGEVYVTVQNGFEIKELHDVQIINPVNKASLYYNLSESLWRDTTAALLVSDTVSMLSKYVNTYSNQTGINGDKTFNNNINIPSYDLGTFTSEKSFNVLFNNDANQKVRLYFPSGSRLQGGYEITLSSGYYFTQASGMLRKTYGVQLQEGGQLYVQSTNVPYVLGAIGNHFTISDFEYDSQTNTWGVIIACLNSNASNYVHINIKSYINPENLSTWLNARASAANITNIYTTNTTVYPNLNPTYLSKSDTASMLLPYVNTYNNQININGNKTFNNVVTIDSATVTGKLLVNTNINDAVKINSNTNSTNLELMNSGGSVYIKSSNKNMILQTDTTALVYLNGDNKKVGILTMNPQQELEVNGNARITGLNNNLVPSRLIGSNNNNDLTNVNLGEGLSFANDTLKVDLTIIDTAIAASSITLTGHVTGTGSTNSTVPTIIGNGIVTNDMLAGSISDTKLNTITTAGKVSNSATTATSTNTNSAIVTRDGSGNFSAGIITASLNGNASTATNVAYSGLTGAVPIWNQNTTGNAATVTSVLPSNFASQTANTVLSAPNGSNGTPTFRSLVSTDIPNLNYLPLTGGTLSGSILNSWTSAYSSAPRNDGAVRRTHTTNLYSANGGNTDRVTHYYTFSQDECCASAPVTMYYGRFNGFYNQANIIYDASIYYHNTNQFYYRAFSESENKVTFSIKPSTTVNVISGTKADLYLSGDAQIDRSLNIGTTLGVTGATTLSNLGGSGNRMVITNNSGTLSTQAIPAGTLVGTDTVSLSNRINTKVGLTGNETINGTKTFGGLIVPTNGMQLTATGNNSNKLIGLNVSSIVGEVTLGSGLSLSNNILSVNGSSGSTNIYALKSGTNVEIIGDISTYSNVYVNMNNNSTITVTLPPANINTNKTVILKNIGTGSVISNNTNIEPLNATGLTNIIMTSGGGKFATLISDGTNWIKMSGN